MIYCSQCGGPISQDSKVCVHFGVSISLNQQKIACPMCGGVVSDNSRFCCHCGCRLPML